MTPKNPETKNECTCVIRHFRTPEERKQGREALQYFRLVGDSVGTILTLAQMGKCGTAK